MPAMTLLRAVTHNLTGFLAFTALTVACNLVAGSQWDRWLLVPILLQASPFIFVLIPLMRARRRGGLADPEFAVSRGGFTTGLAGRRVAAVLCVVAFADQFGDSLHSRQEWHRVVAPVLLVASVVVSAWLIGRDCPRLQLRPEGVVRIGLRRRLVPWHALRSGRLLWARGRPRALMVAEPELIEPPSYESRVVLGYWDVPDDRVVHAIEWYVAHPEDRPAIGTRPELDRLNARYAEALSGPDRAGASPMP
jgi:hypothetical protein